jgi:hypothetical protein
MPADIATPVLVANVVLEALVAFTSDDEIDK